MPDTKAPIIIWINKSKRKKSGKILFIFLLGAIIYGVYATTNYALINNWEPKIALIDTIWGGILFYLTTYISYYISNKYL